MHCAQKEGTHINNTNRHTCPHSRGLTTININCFISTHVVHVALYFDADLHNITMNAPYDNCIVFVSRVFYWIVAMLLSSFLR